MKFEERVLQQEFTLNDTDDLIVDYIRKNKEIRTFTIQKGSRRSLSCSQLNSCVFVKS